MKVAVNSDCHPGFGYKPKTGTHEHLIVQMPLDLAACLKRGANGSRPSAALQPG